MSNLFRDSYRLLGVVPYQLSLPCFGLPVFIKAGRAGLYVQEIDELGRVVSGFRSMEGSDDADIVSVPGFDVRVGMSPVYAFIESALNIHIGAIDVIGPKLSDFARENALNYAICLQIAELIGSDEEKRRARILVRNSIRNKSGPKSSDSFYYGSAMKSALWDALTSCVDDLESAKRILSARVRLDAFYDDGKVILNLSALEDRDRQLIDEEHVKAVLCKGFDFQGEDYVDTFEAAPSSVELPSVTEVTEVLREINQIGRQEERIAVLLSHLIEDKKLKSILFREYRTDRGKFASWVLEKLREKVADGDFSEINLEELIRDMNRNVFPMNKGFLLYSLAKHLHGNKIASKVIKEIIDRSQDSNISWYIGEINNALEGGKSFFFDRS